MQIWFFCITILMHAEDIYKHLNKKKRQFLSIFTTSYSFSEEMTPTFVREHSYDFFFLIFFRFSLLILLNSLNYFTRPTPISTESLMKLNLFRQSFSTN